MGIEQRPARISGIDRSVSLNRPFNQSLILGMYRTLQAADDSGGQRSIQPKRVSDCQDFLSDDQSVGISHLHNRQRLFRRFQQSDDREICFRVTTNHPRWYFVAVPKTTGSLLATAL